MSSSTTGASKGQNVQKKERYSTEKSRPFINYGYFSDLKNWSILALLQPEFVSQIYMIMAFEDGRAALIVTKDRTVYGIGENCNGQLGIGNATDTFQPKKVEALSGKDIKMFCCDYYEYPNQYHVFALTQKGEVYSWGFDRNRLGLGLRSRSFESEYMPILIITNSLSKEHIIDIACSKMHTIALTNNGKIYTWGTSEYVHLSNGRENGLPKQVKHQFTREKIIFIACGDGFNMVLSNSGKVYSRGMNARGQLGLHYCNSWTDPFVMVSLEDAIIKVACGSMHTLALTAKGELYTWGNNIEGQLGHGNIVDQSIPIKLNVPEMGKVTDIAAQSCGSIAINENGRVYVWGTTTFAKKLLMPTVTLFTNIYDIIKYKKSYIIQNPFIDHREEESNMLWECLEAAFDDQLTSDLTIMVEEQPIHVHKTFLKIRCLYFRNMFQHNWIENDKKIIVHNQYSYVVYKAFLKYLYTGSVIDLPLEKALELLKLADEYGEISLKRYCTQSIKKAITVSNVIFIYTEAVKYNSKELEEFCFQNALGDLTKVVQTESFGSFFSLKEDVLDFIIKAAKAGAFKN